jgi:hypothetical protein
LAWAQPVAPISTFLTLFKVLTLQKYTKQIGALELAFHKDFKDFLIHLTMSLSAMHMQKKLTLRGTRYPLQLKDFSSL